MVTIQIPYVEVQQHGLTMYLTKLSAKVLTMVSYVAVRGVDDEEGAVQRLLNKTRIAAVRDFTLSDGLYPNSIILNWTHKLKPKIAKTISLPLEAEAAQVIDGQHRVAGIAAAISESAQYGKMSIPVAIFVGLDTRRCADIFLSINTEQRPVSKSLVYDLYGIASEHIKDLTAERAKDIAARLNEDVESPYYSLIRFPGAEKNAGVDLSTVVNALKPLVDQNGTFESLGFKDLEKQIKLVRNYLDVLRAWYGPVWSRNDNVFLSAAGFQGAIEFLKNKMIPYCRTRSSMTKETIQEALGLNRKQLLLKDQFKGMQSRKVMRAVEHELGSRFSVDGGAKVDILL